MRRHILTGFAALALLLTAACSSNDSIKQAVDQSVQQFEAAGEQGMENDALFAAEAASASMMEVQLSQAAAEMAVSPEVKQLAQDLDQANQQMLNELQDIASQNNFVLPSTIGSRHNDVYREVTSKSGIAFDLAYVNRLAREHDELLERYEDMARNGQVMALKQYASKQLPLLSQQQQTIEELQRKIEDI